MLNIKLNIEEKRWLEYDPKIEKNIFLFLEKIIPYTKIKSLLDQKINIEISFLLTNNKKIQELNKNYRQKNKATNILAFPLYDLDLKEERNLDELLFNNNLILGDLILSLEYLQNEAKEQEKNIDHHLKHLIIHGLLHLIGYDHITKIEQMEMEEIEIKILNLFDIKNPYEKLL
jgi:probable rRNA maturation factor